MASSNFIRTTLRREQDRRIGDYDVSVVSNKGPTTKICFGKHCSRMGGGLVPDV